MMKISGEMIGLIYLVAVNLGAFGLMGLDKWKARRRRWRISEKMLFLGPILGGALGGLAGMYHFRHKTKHWYFKYGFVAIFLVEYGLGLYVLTN